MSCIYRELLPDTPRMQPAITLRLLIHAFITSRFSYCNGVLSEVTSKALDRPSPKLSRQGSHPHQALAAHHPNLPPPLLAPT